MQAEMLIARRLYQLNERAHEFEAGELVVFDNLSADGLSAVVHRSGSTEFKMVAPEKLDELKGDLQITISSEHASILTQALDMYTRVLLGQLENISNAYQHELMKRAPVGHIESYQDVHLLEEKLLELKEHCLKVPRYGGLGIHNKQAPDSARVAFDMMCMIKQITTSMEGTTPFAAHSVWLNEPYQHSKLPLVKVDVV